MESIKLTGTSHNGKLTVAVPKEFDEKELEIMIVSFKDKENKEDKDQEKINTNERAEKFMKLVGSVKHPDFPMTKFDIYDQ